MFPLIGHPHLALDLAAELATAPASKLSDETSLQRHSATLRGARAERHALGVPVFTGRFSTCPQTAHILVTRGAAAALAGQPALSQLRAVHAA
jgi:hypothetical protein